MGECSPQRQQKEKGCEERQWSGAEWEGVQGKVESNLVWKEVGETLALPWNWDSEQRSELIKFEFTFWKTTLEWLQRGGWEGGTNRGVCTSSWKRMLLPGPGQ